MFKEIRDFGAGVSIAAAVFCLSFASAAKADTVEVLLGQVFVPSTGYGSNNNVLLTLDGRLPNSCYQLSQPVVDVQDGGHTFVVHQFAELQSEGVCAPGAALPNQLAGVVPYTYDVSLGRLAAGEYRVVFNQISSFPGSRNFSVYQSRNLTADDFPYAAVSSVSISDVVSGLSSVTAQISGVLTTTCSYLATVKVSKENDVIVVQPVLGVRNVPFCGQIMMPFNQTIDLGRLQEGRYLLHVRTANGGSISHAFSVVTPDGLR